MTTLATKIAQIIGHAKPGTNYDYEARKGSDWFWSGMKTRSSPWPLKRGINNDDVDEKGIGKYSDNKVSRHDGNVTTQKCSVLTTLYDRLMETCAKNFSSHNLFQYFGGSLSSSKATRDIDARMSYFTPPIYVCSGGANSILEAHRIQHYIRGIIHRKSWLRKGIDEWDGSCPLLQHSVDHVGAKEIDIVDECFSAVKNGFYTYNC